MATKKSDGPKGEPMTYTVHRMPNIHTVMAQAEGGEATLPQPEEQTVEVKTTASTKKGK